MDVRINRVQSCNWVNIDTMEIQSLHDYELGHIYIYINLSTNCLWGWGRISLNKLYGAVCACVGLIIIETYSITNYARTRTYIYTHA